MGIFSSFSGPATWDFMPKDLQKRVVRSLVSSSIGAYVEVGQDDAQNIDFQLARGVLSLQNVVLRSDRVKRFLPPNLVLRRGVMGRIVLRLPWAAGSGKRFRIEMEDFEGQVQIVNHTHEHDQASVLLSEAADSLSSTQILGEDERAMFSSQLGQGDDMDFNLGIYQKIVDSILSKLELHISRTRVSVLFPESDAPQPFTPVITVGMCSVLSQDSMSETERLVQLSDVDVSIQYRDNQPVAKTVVQRKPIRAPPPLPQRPAAPTKAPPATASSRPRALSGSSDSSGDYENTLGESTMMSREEGQSLYRSAIESLNQDSAPSADSMAAGSVYDSIPSLSSRDLNERKMETSEIDADSRSLYESAIGAPPLPPRNVSSRAPVKSFDLSSRTFTQSGSNVLCIDHGKIVLRQNGEIADSILDKLSLSLDTQVLSALYELATVFISSNGNNGSGISSGLSTPTSTADPEQVRFLARMNVSVRSMEAKYNGIEGQYTVRSGMIKSSLRSSRGGKLEAFLGTIESLQFFQGVSSHPLASLKLAFQYNFASQKAVIRFTDPVLQVILKDWLEVLLEVKTVAAALAQKAREPTVLTNQAGASAGTLPNAIDFSLQCEVMRLNFSVNSGSVDTIKAICGPISITGLFKTSEDIDFDFQIGRAKVFNNFAGRDSRNPFFSFTTLSIAKLDTNSAEISDRQLLETLDGRLNAETALPLFTRVYRANFHRIKIDTQSEVCGVVARILNELSSMNLDSLHSDPRSADENPSYDSPHLSMSFMITVGHLSVSLLTSNRRLSASIHDAVLTDGMIHGQDGMHLRIIVASNVKSEIATLDNEKRSGIVASVSESTNHFQAYTLNGESYKFKLFHFLLLHNPASHVPQELLNAVNELLRKYEESAPETAQSLTATTISDTSIDGTGSKSKNVSFNGELMFSDCDVILFSSADFTSGATCILQLNSVLCEFSEPDNYIAGFVDGATIKLANHTPMTKEDLFLVAREIQGFEFVQVGSLSNLKLELLLGISPIKITIKSTDSQNSNVNLTTCADSTQTLIAFLNDLKPPADGTAEDDAQFWTSQGHSDEPSGSMHVSTLIEEDAFGPKAEKPMLIRLPEDQVNLKDGIVADDMESQAQPELVESYYGSGDGSGDGSGGESRSAPKNLGDASVTEPTTSEQKSSQELVVNPDHFLANTVLLDVGSERNSSTVAMAIKLKGVRVDWNLHDGYDWLITRQALASLVDQIDTGSRAPSASTATKIHAPVPAVGAQVFGSTIVTAAEGQTRNQIVDAINRDVQAGTPRSATPDSTVEFGKTLKRMNKKSLQVSRSRHPKVIISAAGCEATVEIFSEGTGMLLNNSKLTVGQFDIIDNVPTSTWNKFMTQLRTSDPKYIGKPMVQLDVSMVRPVAMLSATELLMSVKLRPVRLHVDQDTLDFLTRFFEFQSTQDAPANASGALFIQRFEIQDVKVCLDYKPKKVDYAGLRSGNTTEFMNFFTLEESDFTLRHVILHGVPGLQRLSETLNGVWMPDIRRNQLGGVLAGLGPIRTIVSLGGGVRDLLVVPLQNSRRDGRYLHHVNNSVTAFAQNTISEAARLGAKFAVGAQTLLESADGYFGGAPSAASSGAASNSDSSTSAAPVSSRYSHQPTSARQGVSDAVLSVQRNMATARQALEGIPQDMHDGDGSAASAVARALPRAVLRPMIGASEAVSNTLFGIRNDIDPASIDRLNDKYSRTNLDHPD